MLDAMLYGPMVLLILSAMVGLLYKAKRHAEGNATH